jgi:osmotically-inducible protein OsmY
MHATLSVHRSFINLPGDIMAVNYDDTKLQQAVLAELAWEPSVTAAHIGVTAISGVVTLTGHVENFAEKHAAESAAARVNGVEAVAEEIEVRLGFDAQRDDKDIAAAVVNRLEWDVAVPRDAIKVKVENGWITLSGEVDWNFQRQAAVQDVRRLLGVVGVSNQIAIKAGVDVLQVRGNLMHALYRSWSDPQNITVTAHGGTVRLTGTARTPHDRNLAAMTAWSTPGATAVVNDITIA